MIYPSVWLDYIKQSDILNDMIYLLYLTLPSNFELNVNVHLLSPDPNAVPVPCWYAILRLYFHSYLITVFNEYLYSEIIPILVALKK